MNDSIAPENPYMENAKSNNLDLPPPTTFDPNEINIRLPQIDDEIDCMAALVIVMTHFETKSLDSGSCQRISEWFHDKYTRPIRNPL